MTSLQNLYYMPTFTDSWLTRDIENTLTTPLENTFYNLSYDPFSPLSNMVRSESTTSSTFTSRSVSSSDHDTPMQKRINAVCNQKITKRKSRAVKKNMTTFILADATNFRQVVQQMTGVKSGVATLDTSEFFFDHCQEFVPHTPTSAIRQEGYYPAEGGADESFPTLESSWGVE